MAPPTLLGVVVPKGGMNSRPSTPPLALAIGCDNNTFRRYQRLSFFELDKMNRIVVGDSRHSANVKIALFKRLYYFHTKYVSSWCE
jgi:hypothetical protein